jgi:diguanylate cyclase (GGDEF)-like protein/PAS domain S-box-containing protein
MYQVYVCITEQHDLRLVFLAGLICLFATYTTFSLLGRAAVAGAGARTSWIAAAALALGCGVWATHFVAMLAYHPHMRINYKLGLTVLSILIAIFVSGVGLAIAASGRMRAALVGGAVVGAGIGAMHYTGMAAMDMAARIDYDPTMVAASLLVGIALTCVATGIGCLRFDFAQRVLATVVLTLAICSLHFTGMSATEFVADASLADLSSSFEPGLLAVAIAAITVLVLALSLGGAVVDQHLAARAETEKERLRSSEARFRQLAGATFEGIVIHIDGIVIDANEALCRLLGLSLEDLVGHRVVEFVHTGSKDPVAAQAMNNPDTATEIELRHSDGSTIPVEIFGQAIDHDGQQARVVAVRDIRERKKAEERIRFMAHHDMLTGLPNRVLFHDRLTQALALAQRNGSTVAVLCLDLDRFKNVNDLLGHGGGDQLLQRVATRLLESVRAHDTVARLSGDEFAIIQTGVPHPDGAATLAERLVASVGMPFELDDQQTMIGTSIGIALYPGDGDTGEELIRAADTALYRAKEAGRHTFRFFEASMDLLLQERSQLERDLRQALATQRELEVHYQPLIDCDAQEVMGFEALVRWNHPQRGPISPVEFIPLAEDCGLILPLGNWVLGTACRDAVRWPENMRVAVNLSPAQFRHADLAGEVLATLQQTGLAADRLELEITEGVLIADTDRTLATLNTLKQAGIHISLDDFGTGYSSLSYLQRFPFDKIKIDRSFVWEMENNPDSMAIVRAVIALGHSLRITVTAEGVETENQLALLQNENCDQVQGYLLGRPVPSKDLASLLLPGPQRVTA